MSAEVPTAADLRQKAAEILGIANGVRDVMRDQPILRPAYEMLTKATTKLAGNVSRMNSSPSFEDVLNTLQDMAHVMGMGQIAAELLKIYFKVKQ